jgi:predicted exporter
MAVCSAPPRKALLRTRLVALAWVVALCVASAWVITARGPAINTNLMALLPSSDRDPVVLAAVDRVQKHFERHFVVLVGAPDFATAKLATDRVAARLAASGQFRKLRVNDYGDLVRHAVSYFLPQRFHLLGDTARTRLRAGDAQGMEREILRRYYAPQSTLNSALIDRDPLLFLVAFLEERSQAAAGKPAFRDGYLTVQSADRVQIVLIGELSGSPFSTKVQRAVMSEIDGLRQGLPDTVPGAGLSVAGVLPHAAVGTQSGIDEASTVGLGSMAAIVVLLIVMFRSVRPFALTISAIGLGCVSGFAACLAIFGEVHFLTLIFGSSLVGISVDYSFHFFCDRFRFRDDWSPAAARRHVFPGITLGLATSAIGFGGLFFAPFPGMQGMAVFSIVGLCVAYGCVMLCYPPMTQRLARPRIDRPLTWVRCYSAWWRRKWSWPAYVAAGSLALIALVGCLRLTASDDVRLLQTPDAMVMAEEVQIRDLIGRNLASQFLLVEGRDPSDFLYREEGLTAKLRELQAVGKLDGHLAISDFVASPQRWADNRALLTDFVAGRNNALGRIAGQIGLPEKTRDAYLNAFRADVKTPAPGIAEWLAHPVSQPHRHLWIGPSERGVVGVVGLRGVYDLDAVRSLAGNDPNIHFVDPAGDISELFGQYRRQTIWLTLFSYAVVLLILVFRYGAVGGLLVMAPPAIAAFVTLGALGFVGQPISLFNVMALLLVLGIGVDYSLFFRETGADNPTTLLAIALSSVTTLLAFGLLAFSATTAIHAFGLTVLVGIFAAFLLSPMSGWLRGAPAASAGSKGISG